MIVFYDKIHQSIIALSFIKKISLERNVVFSIINTIKFFMISLVLHRILIRLNFLLNIFSRQIIQRKNKEKIQLLR